MINIYPVEHTVLYMSKTRKGLPHWPPRCDHSNHHNPDNNHNGSRTLCTLGWIPSCEIQDATVSISDLSLKIEKLQNQIGSEWQSVKVACVPDHFAFKHGPGFHGTNIYHKQAHSSLHVLYPNCLPQLDILHLSWYKFLIIYKKLDVSSNQRWLENSFIQNNDAQSRESNNIIGYSLIYSTNMYCNFSEISNNFFITEPQNRTSGRIKQETMSTTVLTLPTICLL